MGERHPDVAPRLRRTIGADLTLAAGVVLLTAGLGTVPPPRALAERAAAHASHRPRDYAVHAATRGHNLVLVASPAAVARTGSIFISLMHEASRLAPLRPKCH